MSIEAMKQALDALGIATTLFVRDRQEGLSAMTLFARDRQEILSAIAALREAIEPAEKQEPVGVSYNEGVSFFKTLKHGTKLYAAPPIAQSLSE